MWVRGVGSHISDTDLYTCGLCWSLAWHLSRLGNLEIATVGPPHCWAHVVVRAGKRFLDIEGLHSATALRKEWGNRIDILGRFTSRQDYLRTLTMRDEDPKEQLAYAKDYCPSRTVAVARRLLIAYSNES